jgi:phosphatidylglycerophosphate synthase
MTPDPSGRRPLKSRDIPFFKWLATRLAAAGVSPNAISFVSIIFGVLAGLTLAKTTMFDWDGLPLFPHITRWFWLAVAVLIQLRLLANMLDGMVAVEGGGGGPTGDLWNEAPDRISDAAMLIGAGFASGSHPYLGFGAALMAVFVAYLRALGASVGAGQCFLGPQAKPHRMAVLTVACLLSAIWPAPRETFGDTAALPTFIELALWIVILGGAITAWRRLAFIARFLRSRKA